MTDAERLALIRRIGDWLYKNTESWEPRHLGMEVAYLLHAIADDRQVALVRGKSPLLFWLMEQEDLAEGSAPIGPDDPVWRFIEVTSADD